MRPLKNKSYLYPDNILIIQIIERYEKTFYLGSVALLFGSALFLNSCIGSFALTNKVKDWNNGVSNKFVNELVFVAFHILPVYEVTMLADYLVLNSLEFWNQKSPLAKEKKVEEIKGENGTRYLVESTQEGYKIINPNKNVEVALTYDEINRTWSANIGDLSYQVLQFVDDNKAIVYMGTNAVKEIELSQEGVNSYRNAVTRTWFSLR